MKKRKIVCVSTSSPPSSLVNTLSGGSLVVLEPLTGSIRSSARLTADISGKTALGVSSVSLLPRNLSFKPNHFLAIGYGSCETRKADSFVMLFTLKSSGTSAPQVHWKCRIPEVTITSGLQISPCGHYVAGGGASGNIYVWSTVGGHFLASFKAHLRAVNCLSWSDCGRTLLTGSADGMIHAFSCADCIQASRESSQVRPFRTWPQVLEVTYIYPLKSRGRFAASSKDGKVNVFEVSSGLLRSVQLTDPVVSLTASNTLLFAGCQSGMVIVIDLLALGNDDPKSDFESKLTDDHSSSSVFCKRSLGWASSVLEGHSRAVTSLQVVEDDMSGALLVSGDEGGVIRVWELRSLCCVQIVQPWSFSKASKNPTLPTTHPVTSINIIDEEILGEVTLPTSWTGASLYTEQHSLAVKRLGPLQRYKSNFIEQRTEVLARRHDEREADFVIQTAAVAEARLVKDEAAASKLLCLEKELKDSQATIKRWEAVNNKLLSRLKKT